MHGGRNSHVRLASDDLPSRGHVTITRDTAGGPVTSAWPGRPLPGWHAADIRPAPPRLILPGPAGAAPLGPPRLGRPGDRRW